MELASIRVAYLGGLCEKKDWNNAKKEYYMIFSLTLSHRVNKWSQRDYSRKYKTVSIIVIF